MTAEGSEDVLFPETAGVIAAGLSNAVGSLFEQMAGAARLKKQDIADRMGVTPSRVSQLLNGDGNVRIATLARFAESCGYELTITATPRDRAALSITVPRRSRRRAYAGTRTPRLEVVQRPTEFYGETAHRRAAQ